MFRIGARDLEDSVIEHDHSEQSECDTGSDQNFIHVVNAKAACLFDPILDERIAQSMLCFRLGKIRAFNDETIFAHFFGYLSRFVFWTKSRRQVRTGKLYDLKL